MLFVAEKPVDGRARQRAKFITLKRPIAEMIPPTSSYWADLLSFASHIEGLAQDDENSEMRVKLFKVGEKELSLGLTGPATFGLHFHITNYSTPMRNTTRLEEIADVGSGYKSLQNDFYYLTRETAKTFQIERRFLSPIYMLGDLAAESFAQLGPAELLLL